jgi:hypothetical protein
VLPPLYFFFISDLSTILIYHSYLPFLPFLTLEAFHQMKLCPLKTRMDGNCLLHAVAKAIWGVEGVYHEVLRRYADLVGIGLGEGWVRNGSGLGWVRVGRGMD